jgi:hypothetical protein
MDIGMGCDFCSHTTPPTWLYPAADFEMMPGHISTGGWLACDGCATLIEAEDWAGLAKRAGERIGGPRATHAALELHSKWRQHRSTEQRTAWG